MRMNVILIPGTQLQTFDSCHSLWFNSDLCQNKHLDNIADKFRGQEAQEAARWQNRWDITDGMAAWEISNDWQLSEQTWLTSTTKIKLCGWLELDNLLNVFHHTTILSLSHRILRERLHWRLPPEPLWERGAVPQEAQLLPWIHLWLWRQPLRPVLPAQVNTAEPPFTGETNVVSSSLMLPVILLSCSGVSVCTLLHVKY